MASAKRPCRSLSQAVTANPAGQLRLSGPRAKRPERPQAAARLDPAPHGGVEAYAPCACEAQRTRNYGAPNTALTSAANTGAITATITTHTHTVSAITYALASAMALSVSIASTANEVTRPEGYGGDFSPPYLPLLRGRVRRSSRRLARSALRVALRLSLLVRFRIALLEVRQRIGGLLRVQSPSATLRASGTRIRLAQVRANHLAGNPKRSSDLLGPRELRIRHITHLLSVSRLHVQRITDTGRCILPIRLGLIRVRNDSDTQSLTTTTIDPPLRPPAIARDDGRRRARGAKRAGCRSFSTFQSPAYKEATAWTLAHSN